MKTLTGRLVMGLLLVAIGTAACSMATDPALSASSIAGTYTVRTFNGSALPATVAVVGPDHWSLLSGSLVIQPNGSWSVSYPLLFTASTGATAPANPVPHDYGTFTISGSVITFRDTTAGSSPFTADVSSSTLTMRHGLLNSFPFTALEFTRQ